jgi:type IV pilus assembly protein PilM
MAAGAPAADERGNAKYAFHLQMLSTHKKTSSVGLDIASDSIAATEVTSQAGRAAGRTAIVPLEPGVVREGDLVNGDALADALKDLFGRYKLNKSVRLGVANQRVIVRTLQLPLIEDSSELEAAVRFRAQDAIPMPLDQAVLDHRVVAKRNGADGNRLMDVLTVAARRDMVLSLVSAVQAAGLNPVGVDLSAFGMIRALDTSIPGASSELGDVPPATTLYCHLGDVTNLAVARGGECLFTRVSPFGVETIADQLAHRDQISIDDARDSLMEVGLEEELELFGDDQDGVRAAREALEEGVTKLVEELRMSMDFYGAQDEVTPIDTVVLCGTGSTIPGLPERVQAGLGLGVSCELPAALSQLDPEDAARLTVSYGLALER